MINFTKASLGLKVNSPEYGDGVIEMIREDDNAYPIKVCFGNGNYEWYTKEGKAQSYHKFPILRVGHFPPLDQGEIPEKEPKPLQFDGTPKWAYVGDASWGHKEKLRRLVVAGNQDIGWLAVNRGEDNTKSISLSEWQYTWEIEE